MVAHRHIQERIVLTDDKAEYRSGFVEKAASLRENGYIVEADPDPGLVPEGFDTWLRKAANSAVVLVDYELETTDGLKVIKALRDCIGLLGGESEPVILLITGKRWAKQVQEMKASEAAALGARFCRKEELWQELETILPVRKQVNAEAAEPESAHTSGRQSVLERRGGLQLTNEAMKCALCLGVLCACLTLGTVTPAPFKLLSGLLVGVSASGVLFLKGAALWQRAPVLSVTYCAAACAFLVEVGLFVSIMRG